MAITLKEKYEKETRKAFQKKFQIQNDFTVPRIEKVVLNTGIGEQLKEKEATEEILESIKQITGQQPVYTRARKSISGFKIRQGQEVGVKVTLRGKRMWDFTEKLVSVALPRVRDFRGIDLSNVDKQGNLNLPIREHIVFPEIAAENVKNVFGFQVGVVTTAETKGEGLELFKMLGFPMKIT